MILSDRTIREEIANGRIVIDPLDQKDIQPSSVDLHDKNATDKIARTTN